LAKFPSKKRPQKTFKSLPKALLTNQLLFTKTMQDVHGGKQLIEFIVRMAALNPNASRDALKVRQSAESIFQLSSSASSETRAFLWPVLLSFLAAPAYYQAGVENFPKSRIF